MCASSIFLSLELLTLLLINLHLGIHVDTKDDEIADNVECAHAHEDLRVFKGNLFRGLHHHEDDDEVGAVVPISVSIPFSRKDDRVRRSGTNI